MKKSVLDTASDLIGKVDRTARKLWITKEIANKMDERSGRMSTTKKELQNTEERTD